MDKIKALWNLFKQGQCVVDPAMWKNRQITVTVLAGVILAIINLVSAFGYAIPIDLETANAIAGGILAVVNTVLTMTTSEKVGIPVKEIEESKPKNDNAFYSETNSNNYNS